MATIEYLQIVNPWLRGEEAPVPPYRRPELQELLSLLREGKNVLVVGARRLGKTTLLRQLGNLLWGEGAAPLYLPMDWPGLGSLGFQELLELGKGRVLLLDEVQDLPGWDKLLKALSEAGARWVATGSGVSLLPGRESGPGRWAELELLPLSYREFLRLRGLPPGPLSWQEYLARGGWPEPALTRSVEDARRLLWEEVVERVIWRDLARGRDTRTLRALLWRVSQRPGGLETGATAQELGISPTTLWNYLELLEAGGVLRILRNLRKPRGAVKVYPRDPGLLGALNPLSQRGPLLETGVMSCLLWRARAQPGVQLGFWRERGREVDFVLAWGEEIVEAYEVKVSGRRLRVRFPFRVRLLSESGEGTRPWEELAG